MAQIGLAVAIIQAAIYIKNGISGTRERKKYGWLNVYKRREIEMKIEKRISLSSRKNLFRKLGDIMGIRVRAGKMNLWIYR